MCSVDELNFDERGLIPAIVVDGGSKEVLTLAYMNRESLEITMQEGRTCFWRKGETRGNVQYVMDISADCDRDALVVRVNKTGPACHLGEESCFHNPLFIGQAEQPFSVKGLYALLEQRKKELPENSYTTYLFQKGLDKILKKVGEECTEVIIAGKARDQKETVYEIADLMYHVMVLMVESGISVDQVLEELGRRHIIDHKVKQEKMT